MPPSKSTKTQQISFNFHEKIEEKTRNSRRKKRELQELIGKQKVDSMNFLEREIGGQKTCGGNMREKDLRLGMEDMRERGSGSSSKL